MDFRNTLIIMTSNVGSPLILEMGHRGQSADEIRDAVLEELRGEFRPEFLNRVDDIIVFDALTPADLHQIVEIQLGSLRRRLAERRIALHLTDAAKDRLAALGYDPAYGARPLKRAISQYVETPLAREILGGQVPDGSVLNVDYADGAFKFDTGVLN